MPDPFPNERPTFCVTMDCGLRATRYVTCDGEGRHPYCEECADVLIRGGESDLGPVTQPRVPDFPNELVEAAAVVCYSLAPEHDTSTYPHGYVPYDEARPSSRENARADALEVLTALYPLIEQRVIDRLAREAGENPYPEFHLPEHDGATGYADPCHAAWDEGAACGVAAERARCPLCNHEWRRHDPEDGRCDCHSETIIGPCQCGRDLAWMQGRIAAMSCAALAPERTTGEGT